MLSKKPAQQSIRLSTGTAIRHPRRHPAALPHGRPSQRHFTRAGRCRGAAQRSLPLPASPNGAAAMPFLQTIPGIIHCVFRYYGN